MDTNTLNRLKELVEEPVPEGLNRGKEMEALIALLKELHPSDIGEFLIDLEDEKKLEVFLLLPAELASSVILETDESTRQHLIGSLSKRRLTELVEEMETDDATDIIAELPEDEARIILKGISKEESEEVEKLLKHKEDTAGGIMQTELVAVNEGLAVDDVIKAIRAVAERIPDIHNVFIINRERRLVGSIPVGKLLLAPSRAKVREIMNPKPVKVRVDLDQEEVARIFQKYDVVSMPVVDFSERLVGRITIDDVVDVIEEEVFEDFYRMAGLKEDDRVFSPPTLSVRKRLPWLFINLFTAIIAASVVGLFQNTIQAVVALAVLMPIVAGMGGNAGTQTLTVIVRGIALGELTFTNAKRTLLKEVIVGIANGVILGVVTALLAYYWKGNYMIGVVIGLAMIINMFVANFTGTIIPLTLKRLKIDPAIASGIFITTFTDVFGFLSFLGLATLFLRYLV